MGEKRPYRSKTSKVNIGKVWPFLSALPRGAESIIYGFAAYVRSDNMAPIPNSESSSFTESVSRHRPFSPIMRPSKTNNTPGEITPPTSFSAPSSQELRPDKPETLAEHVPVQQPEGQTHVRVSPIPSDVGYPPQSPISPASVRPEARKVPNKRMANGEVKRATQSLLGHQIRSNKSSVTSRNIQISEASSHCLQKEINRNVDYDLLVVKSAPYPSLLCHG